MLKNLFSQSENKFFYKEGNIYKLYMIITKSRLAIILSKLRQFENPKFLDEQYTTDSEIAAMVLWNAYMSGNIKGKTIAYLGAGTGILGIGALLLGAKKVFFVEKDENAVKILKENLEGTKEAY